MCLIAFLIVYLFILKEMEPVIMVPTPQVPMPAPPPVSNSVQPSPGSILLPRVNIRGPPPFSYTPILPTQSSQVCPILVLVLMKGGKKFITMSNLNAVVAAIRTSQAKKQDSKADRKKKKQPWVP